MAVKYICDECGRDCTPKNNHTLSESVTFISEIVGDPDISVVLMETVGDNAVFCKKCADKLRNSWLSLYQDAVGCFIANLKENKGMH